MSAGSVTCPKCKGTGDIGVFGSSRCNMCGGTGELVIESLQGLLLYEWVEGVLDLDTDDSWLENQMERIMRVRRKARSGGGGDGDGDGDGDFED